MKLEDEIVSELSQMIIDSISDEVLESVTGEDLIQQGWTQVSRNAPWYEPDPYLWHRWFDNNIHGKYRAFNRAIYFQDETDAVMYKLRWT